MKRQFNLLLLLLCMQFSVSCQQKEDCEKCAEEAKVYLYEKPDNHWIKIYQYEKEGTIALGFSQNPSERIFLDIVEQNPDYILTSYKSKQENASGGNKIEGQIKFVFQDKNLVASGLAPDGQTLIFKEIKDDGLTQFLPIYSRKTRTKVGQPAFYKDKNIPKDFYKNLAQVLCYYGVIYEERVGKIYVSTVRYYEEEELMWNCTTKAQDAKWLEEHVCKE